MTTPSMASTGHFVNSGRSLKVKTTCPTITRESRLVLPAGTIGRVIEYQCKQAQFIIDFGLMTVITLPVDSPLVEIVNGNGGMQ